MAARQRRKPTDQCLCALCRLPTDGGAPIGGYESRIGKFAKSKKAAISRLERTVRCFRPVQIDNDWSIDARAIEVSIPRALFYLFHSFVRERFVLTPLRPPCATLRKRDSIMERNYTCRYNGAYLHEETCTTGSIQEQIPGTNTDISML